MRTSNVRPITALDGVSAGKPILQSVLDALNEGRIAEAVAQFDDHFTFTDHALDLEFTDKSRLIEFFQKARELFPDTVVEVDSSFQCGGYVSAETYDNADCALLSIRGPSNSNFLARSIDRSY